MNSIQPLEIARRAEALANMDKNIKNLMQAREKLKNELVSFVTPLVKNGGHKPKEDLPRGVITLGVLKTLEENGPLSSGEIVNKAKKLPVFRGVPNLPQRLRHVIYSSDRFKKVDGTYVPAEGYKDSPLFKRLEAQLR